MERKGVTGCLNIGFLQYGLGQLDEGLLHVDVRLRARLQKPG